VFWDIGKNLQEMSHMANRHSEEQPKNPGLISDEQGNVRGRVIQQLGVKGSDMVSKEHLAVAPAYPPAVTYAEMAFQDLQFILVIQDLGAKGSDMVSKEHLAVAQADTRSVTYAKMAFKDLQFILLMTRL
jgi:hypothetical protein